MKSIIKELWDGNVHPQESENFDTPEIRKLLLCIGKQREKLEKDLLDEQKEILQQMMYYRNKYEGLIESEAFACGFRLGVRMIIDVMFGEEKMKTAESN